MLRGQVGVAHPYGLADPVLTPGPRRPVRARVAVDDGSAEPGLAVALHNGGNEPWVGPEVAGVDHGHPGSMTKGGDIGPGALDQLAGAEEPEAEDHSLKADPGEHLQCIGDGWAGHPGEAGVHEGCIAPFGHQPGGLGRVAVGVGI